MSNELVDRNRLLIPALGGLYEKLAPAAYPIMRIWLGLDLMPHGYRKFFGPELPGVAKRLALMGVPEAHAVAYFIAALELVGGLMLACGLFTRIVAVMVAIEMAVISFAILAPHWEWVHHGMEYPLMMCIFALAIALRGGGRFSLDHLIGKEF